jgi:tetratricopeptide (TPR) repeat protein
MPDSHTAQSRHAFYYLGVAQDANDIYKRGGTEIKIGLAKFDQDWANIQLAQTWACKNAADGNWAAIICNNFPNAAAEILVLRQHPREQIRWREAALEVARRRKDRTAEAAHLGSIGNAYNSLGDARRAVDIFKGVLAVAQEIKNENLEAAALMTLGLASMYLGETHQAIESYEQALDIFREVGDRRAEGSAFGYLGLAYGRLGEFRRAIGLHEQHLVVARETGDRSGEGAALNNLGNLYRNLGDVRRAIDYHRQKLMVARDLGDSWGRYCLRKFGPRS